MLKTICASCLKQNMPSQKEPQRSSLFQRSNAALEENGLF
jgi:hypothetical protein